MTYLRSGFGQSCDASTMVASVNGNYQCCPDDSACIAEAGLPTGTAPAPDGGSVGTGLQYGATPSSTPWWVWVLVALGLGGAVTYAGAS